MKITIEKLLKKMEAELQHAKLSESEGQRRERIQAIKTLCELALDEEDSLEVKTAKMISSPASFTLGQPKKLEVDEEANGDSLFDF